MQTSVKAVILAAGKGTRLQTDECDSPKVMRRACGKPLLSYVLDALSFVKREDTIIVVGYKKEEIIAAFPGFVFAVQAEQLGTGHAAASAREQLAGFDGAVLVCCGDMPALRRGTYESLITVHFDEGNDCTMLTGSSALPLPYGRVLRDGNGQYLQIVEDRDCTPEQKKITELNAGVYVFSTPMLLSALGELKNDNAQGEYYLTDAPAVIKSRGGKIGICRRELGSEIIGVNTPEQLKQAEELLR